MILKRATLLWIGRMILNASMTLNNHPISMLKMKSLKFRWTSPGVKQLVWSTWFVFWQYRQIVGLCLAKRIGYDGVFVRDIVPESLASQDGNIRIGDKVCQINGKFVSDESPSSIVKFLKDIDGTFTIQFKRPKLLKWIVLCLS